MRFEMHAAEEHVVYCNGSGSCAFAADRGPPISTERRRGLRARDLNDQRHHARMDYRNAAAVG